MNFLLERLDGLYSLIKKTRYTNSRSEIIPENQLELINALIQTTISKNKKIFVVGNGGSSGIASHHVVDLVNVLKASAFALSDSNLLTCMGNDYGYSFIFSKPLESLAHEGDLLIAISSSGKSENILQACRVMNNKNADIITLSGFDESNPLRKLGDVNIWVDAFDYGLVESAHFFILHTIIDYSAKKHVLTDLLNRYN